MKEKFERFKKLKVWRISVGFFWAAVIMFSFVWWPIQAERARVNLRDCQDKLAQKKSELNALNAKYASMTTLPLIDQWAKTHGPWKNPNADDIITID